MRIFNLFKKKPKEPPYNINHPDVADKIEFAFECGPMWGKRKFYRFKAAEGESNEFDQRTGRYIWIEGFLKQCSRKLTDEALIAFMEDLKKHLSGENGSINLGKAFKVIHTIEALAKLAFEPELVKRLASCVYFDEHEDLRSFDRRYAEEKIKFWEKYDSETMSFFLSSPIAELCNLRGFSAKSLQIFIQEREQILQDLTLVTPTSSSESS